MNSMFFDNMVYGNNIKVIAEDGLFTGQNPRTSLVQQDAKGASCKDDNGNSFLLVFEKGQNLFMIARSGHVYEIVFDRVEDDDIVDDNGIMYNLKNIIFIGELED